MRVVETHISVLFFTGNRVYKLRKPVQFDFVDWTDRVAREVDCHREVELNRRLAPDVYLGVADIVLDGEAVDHMVVMREMPDDRRLATMIENGDDVGGWVTKVAVRLADFHDGARRSSDISEAGTKRALERAWSANFEETERFVGPIISPQVEQQLRNAVDRWLQMNQDLLEERIASGKICDGHGDLQAADIFCLDDGVRILDCLEFSDRLRYGDVCADVAFLAMDLEHLGRPDDAAQFIRDYESRSGDTLPSTLLHHYVAQRAYIRAKVACLRCSQGSEDDAVVAREFHALALRHLQSAQPVMVLVGGLPGTGKSTLAAGLAGKKGWTLLSTDHVRRVLQPIVRDRVVTSSPSGPDVGRYRPAAVNAVYDKLLEQGRSCLEAGESVILDASWVDPEQRAKAAQTASDAGSQYIEFRCTCGETSAKQRIIRRECEDDAESDATPQVYAILANREAEWPSSIVIDSSERSPSECLELALQSLGSGRSRSGVRGEVTPDM